MSNISEKIMVQNASNPILIYQMGKVGSSTIKKSLELSNLSNAIEQVHFLSWSYIETLENEYLKQNKPVPSHITLGKLLRQQIDQSSGKVRFKIVTLVRDPIARDISDVFQNIQRDIPYIVNLNHKQAVDEILGHILGILYQFDETTDYACTWFDKEIKNVFQFDIFSYPFDKHKGYQIFSTQNADILVLRLENLTTCHKIAFHEFLGLENFTLLAENQGKKKWYSDVYDHLLEKIDIPDSVLNKIYNSRYAKHFYTEYERIAFRKKWQIKSRVIKKNINFSQSNRTKILFIHPEGNILGNPNFSDMVELLCENGFDIHIFAPIKKNVIQKSPCKESKLFLFEAKEDPSVSDCFTILSKQSFLSEPSIMDFINAKVGDYDFVIGIDRGIIEAELISRAKKIPYALISYEIFFEVEAGAQFKAPEIKACQNIEFAVVQDTVRAKMLSQENSIPLSKMIYIPVAGRSANINSVKKKYYLHESLNIGKSKKIVLYIGSIANWTMADYILESTRYWPDDWVLVINNRYANKTNPYYAHYYNRDRIFFCAHPSENVRQLENILLSADIGVALYSPLKGSIGCGNNIRYIGMSSGKIGTYLKYGLPVITNDIGEMSACIKKYELGTVVDVRKPLLPCYSAEKIISWKKNCIQFFNTQLDLNISIKPFIQKLKNITSNHDKKNEINTILYQAKQALQQGNMAKSIQLLLMIVDKNPDHPMALHYLGVIHLKIGEREQGLRYMNKAYNNS